MSDRTRSPSYPSTPIQEAIEYARKIHLADRTNAVDREVAAKAMGYTGISGRSATILSDLNQYGLVEKTGKSELRVSALAVDLIHPDDQESWEAAIWRAARKPELFQRVAERFTDGRPSDTALESFLIKQGFTYAAIPSAVRAFRETFSYLENATGGERTSSADGPMSESSSNQSLDEATPMNRPMLSSPTKTTPPGGAGNAPSVPTKSGATFGVETDRILLGGVLTTQAEADHAISVITALKSMLRPAPVVQDPAPTTT